ncbi:MAG: hypothetical protein ABRQ39_21330 [Candidatus Eremiobacterota bacterium]
MLKKFKTIYVILFLLYLISGCGDGGTDSSVLSQAPAGNPTDSPLSLQTPLLTPVATSTPVKTATSGQEQTVTPTPTKTPAITPAKTPVPTKTPAGTATITATPAYNAELTVKSADITIDKYDVKEVRIEFKNTGILPWDPARVHLAPSNPRNRITHLQYPGDTNNWLSATRIKMQQKSPVEPGQIAEFIFYISPDSEYISGIQGFEMVADSIYEGVTHWFGQNGYAEVNIEISEKLYYLAELVSKSPDTTVERYQTKQLTVTFKNIGTVAWSPYIVHLGTTNPQSKTSHLYTADGTWLNDNRIGMQQTEPVQPGQTADFIFNITPDTLYSSSKQEFELVADGTYNGVPDQWFGWYDGYVQIYVTVTEP